jgi:hypothetical protein
MNKSILLLIPLVIILNYNTYSQYSGGSGTSGDPYQISNLDDLSELCQATADWSGKYFIQTANIDASQTQYWDDSDDNSDGDKYNDPNDATSTGSNQGFSPIGNSTTNWNSSYDGGGYTISGITIVRKFDNQVGFFGRTSMSGKTIENLGLVNADIWGWDYVGGIVGFGNYGTIQNCYFDGAITGGGSLGGFIGSGTGITIHRCYSKGSVTSSSMYGNKYDIGGFIGFNNGSNIYDCYSHSTANGYGRVAGFIANNGSGSVNNCYSKGLVLHQSTFGGFEAYHNYGSANNCFFDSQTAGTSTSSAGLAMNTLNMTQSGFFTNAGWDFVGETTNGTNDYWDIDGSINDGYPYLYFGPSSPTVTTQAVSNIGLTTATGNGSITNLGGANVTERGIYYSTTNGFANGTGTKVSTTGNWSSTGAFTQSITGLTANTTYYVKAFATNSAGTAYGSQVSFTTDANLTVTTQAVTDITKTTATGNGNITALGGANVTERGIYYSTTDGFANGTGTKVSTTGNWSSTGAFTQAITGLSLNTTYYVKAFATNSNGTAYGSQVSFTTLNNVTTTTYTYTGSHQYWTVPSGVSQITVKVWGAGGGGRTGSYSTYTGGSGGYTEATLNVTPGQQLCITVGQGGQQGSTIGGNGGWPGGGYGTAGDASGGGGGGVVGVFINSYAHANALIIAGSGGSGGYRYGGAGGGTTGGNGSYGGNGGTQSAGGTGTNGADGSALQGGNGDANGSQTISSGADGGGGGAGYYGGEGGYGDAGGGAGGSAYVNPSYLSGSATLTQGNQGVYGTSVDPPNTSDEDYVAGVGVGGGSSASYGGNGLVVIDYSSTLPVTWLSFSGERIDENSILIKWSTASEINCSGFYVQSSSNGVDFNNIGFIQGGVNSTTILNYTFIDKNSKKEGLYYRLKQVDFDGRVDYSKIIYVSNKNSDKVLKINIYPNPASENIFVSGIKSETNIVIKDQMGKIVFQKLAYEETIKLDLSELSKGMYFIRAKSEEGIINRKLIIN